MPASPARRPGPGGGSVLGRRAWRIRGSVDHSELVPALFPKSRGIRVGSVVDVTRRGVIVQIDRVSGNGRMRIDPGHAPLKPGDGVVFDEGRPERQEQGGRVYEVFALK